MNEQNRGPRYNYVVRAHQLCLELNDIIMLINSSHDIDEILHEVVEESSKSLGCESARIAMREGDNWVIRYVSNLPAALLGQSFTDKELPHAALAMRTGKPVAIDDAFHDGRTNTEMMKSLGMRSVMVLPLLEKNVVTGTLSYGYHTRAVSFSEVEIDYAERIATGVALALQDAHLYQELEESKRLGDALNEIETVLYSSHDYDYTMNKMLQLSTDVIGAETGVIFSKDGDRWRVRYEYKLPVSLLGQSFSNTEVMHTAVTAETKRSLVVQDALHSPAIDQKFVEMLGIRSLLDFPLIVKGEVIGDLTFHYHSSPVPFNERQVEFVRKLQISISLALENARLLDTALQGETKLKEAEKLGKFGNFTCDLVTGRIVWSEGMFHILGRDPVLGAPTVEEFFESYSVDPRREKLRGLLGKQETSEFDATIKRGDLTCILHVSVRSVKDLKGDLAAVFGTIQDITDRKNHEEKIKELNLRLAQRADDLEMANKELEAFNHTVAHDLRQPLNLLGMCCQSIKRLCGDQLKENCADYVQDAYQATVKMNQLIGALLNFSQMGRVEPLRERVDLSAIVHEVSRPLQLSEPGRRVDLKIADGMLANGDATLLRAVLDNLLGNAWKYTSMRELAIIEFGVRDIEGVPTYFVRDNGAGFDQSDADQLFTPFTRLPDTERYKGFGIGLATVERIIRRHGGRVWAEGEPGKGACFFFTLPVSPAV